MSSPGDDQDDEDEDEDGPDVVKTANGKCRRGGGRGNGERGVGYWRCSVLCVLCFAKENTGRRELGGVGSFQPCSRSFHLLLGTVVSPFEVVSWNFPVELFF